MANKIKKNDFIELEFTGKIKDTNEIFDTNIKEDAEKAKLDIKEFKPFVLSVGNSMIIKGLDNSLEEKEPGQSYIEEFLPEQAFGKRNPSLVKMLPLKAFTDQKIIPQKGMQLSLDNMLVKIVSVSGGRVLVDLNNPLAGKTVEYNFKINKIVEDLNEKINSLQDFFFKKRFDFSLDDEKKQVKFKISEKETQVQQFIKFFEKPFNEILGLKVESEVVKEEKKEKAEEIKNENSN